MVVASLSRLTFTNNLQQQIHSETEARDSKLTRSFSSPLFLSILSVLTVRYYLPGHRVEGTGKGRRV